MCRVYALGEHCDLEARVILADVAHPGPHVINGFAIAFQGALERASVEEIHSIFHRVLPLLCKFAVPFPVIVDGLLGRAGKPSCERRRIGQRKTRKEFRTPYKGITRARARVRVIRVKPLGKKIRASLEMIFCFLLELSGEFQRDALRFTEVRQDRLRVLYRLGR